MGPATGLTCPHSLVADGPLEADALLALEEALRVDLGLDRLELREAVRAPGVLLQRDALLFLLGVREVGGAVDGWLRVLCSMKTLVERAQLLLLPPKVKSAISYMRRADLRPRLRVSINGLDESMAWDSGVCC